MAHDKNHWIIPPTGDHTITMEGLEASQKVTPESGSKDSFERSGVQCAWVGPGSQMRCGLQVHDGWAF